MSKSVSEVYEDLSELLSERRKEFFSGLLVVLLCGAVAFFMWWWYVVRWQAPPSIFNSSVQNVLG